MNVVQFHCIALGHILQLSAFVFSVLVQCFCVDPKVEVAQQLMQQRAGRGGSDVLVGQILNIVLTELCALHSRQMLKQLSHVATLLLFQQHQYNLQKQHYHHSLANPQLLGTKRTDYYQNNFIDC